MAALVYLIPASILLGLVGLGAFVWALRNNQFDDPEGDAQRILRPDFDDHPRED
ncbi:MAG: cbb3-type cytochrome oxidase assembly protein CcoS [Alphaproteobacteria bacterium]|nr:MAG: cbb3-type cytochrome oxidase assembly protein CcoS [Alphaproteobacteria bacterium]